MQKEKDFLLQQRPGTNELFPYIVQARGQSSGGVLLNPERHKAESDATARTRKK